MATVEGVGAGIASLIRAAVLSAFAVGIIAGLVLFWLIG
jgi:hypothetical protein